MGPGRRLIKKCRLFLSVVALFFIVSCLKGLPEEFPAPDFSVRDIFTGEEIRLSDLRGRPVLIYFFASW